MTAFDAPFMPAGAAAWDLLIQSGRVLVWGHAFDPETGFLVYLGFADSIGRTLASAADTRRIADEKLDPRVPDQALLAGQLRKMAEQVDALNQGWEAAGRPADAFEGVQGGRA